MLTVAQTMKNTSNFMVGKSSLQEIAPLAIIWEISDSHLENGRYGPNSGVSRIIRESWPHCVQPCNSSSLEIIIYQTDTFSHTHRNTGANFTCPLDHQTCTLTCSKSKFTCPWQSDLGFFLPWSGSSNNLEGIPGSIIYHYNQQRPHLFSKNFA